MSAFEMLAFFRFIKFYNEGEITMVSVRKRGKVYEYRFEIATIDGTRKWITKSGYPTKAEAFYRSLSINYMLSMAFQKTIWRVF